MTRQPISLRLLIGLLDRLIERGSLTLVDAEGELHRFGDGGPPRAIMHVSDPKVYAGLVFHPELKLGEAYMDGTLFFEESSVRDLMHIVHLNSDKLRGGLLRRFFANPLKRLRRFHQHNPVTRARKNVSHHYDISNDMFSLFLDSEMNYSCAYFETPRRSLEEAQRAKLRHIAAKLRLRPGMRVLDIGCGWGAMAIYLAENFDVEVLGVTLSIEQWREAKARAVAHGLNGEVEFRLCDYREVEGTFDRIVSIGMFEHVGLPYYRRFFENVKERLNDNGLALIHSIGIKGGPNATGPWIRKYIFPGGYSPALSEVTTAVEKTGLWITDVEILRLHYAETLKEWARRFAINRSKAADLFDERFCRMWEYFLAVSESAFRYGGHMVWQMQLAKKVDALPLTRDYSFDKERELRKVEAPAVATNPVRPSFGTALSLHPQEARRPSQRIKNKALED
jgi:cyclopropane-fatty-acyl-phospholipid synthase